MEELLPVLLITLSAVLQYCKSQVITNLTTICEPLYFQWNQSCGELSDKRDNGIAIYITFDDISHAMMAEKPAKKFAACSEFLFCLFSHFHGYCGCTELSVALLCNTILGATKLTSKLWIHENHIMWTMEWRIKWRMIIICR